MTQIMMGLLLEQYMTLLRKKPIIVTLDRCIDLLNQQDKRIKELEVQNEKLFAEARYKSCEYCKDKTIIENDKLKEENNKFFEESQQLKQELDKYKETVQELQENNSKIFDESLYYRVNYNELKQQLHDLSKKIVEEIKDFAEIQIKNLIKFGYYADKRNRGLRPINYYDLMETLNTILKKYGGEDDL